jgi:hypothetical protein
MWNVATLADRVGFELGHPVHRPVAAVIVQIGFGAWASVPRLSVACTVAGSNGRLSKQ